MFHPIVLGILAEHRTKDLHREAAIERLRRLAADKRKRTKR